MVTRIIVKCHSSSLAGRPGAAQMIRLATRADISRLMQIRNSVRENRLSDPSRVTLADYRWFIDHAGVHLWDEDGLIKGLSAGDPRNGSIWALFVDPAFEGRGIAQALIRDACQSLITGGHRFATLIKNTGTRTGKLYLTIVCMSKV